MPTRNLRIFVYLKNKFFNKFILLFKPYSVLTSFYTNFHVCHVSALLLSRKVKLLTSNYNVFCCQIKLVNINAADVVDGRPAVVLGLIWTIILYFQVWASSSGHETNTTTNLVTFQ